MNANKNTNKPMRIPYGIHDYKTIQTGNYLFVDKTRFIEQIEQLGEYLVFLRPRRFGKSLFTSMLYHYYDTNSADAFDQLFGDVYIGKNKTEEANAYHILKFDFSGMNTERELIRRSFYRKVKVCTEMFMDYNDIHVDISDDIQEANEYLESFLRGFRAHATKPIYLIIDEYDHFANDVLTTDINLFWEIIGKDGFVRKFYEVFKTYAGSVIGRMFITGVTSITLDSLSSGFNNATNLSTDEALNEMMGFTEKEVLGALETMDVAKEHLAPLKENYNGYLFSEDANERVYNSNMVLYYLRSMVLSRKPPKNLTDPNIVSDYTRITSMFDLYHDYEDKKNVIHHILDDGTITGTIVDKFNAKLGFGKDDFLSLLYYLGLVTIEGGYGVETGLVTPNNVIKTVYFEYYYHYLNQELQLNVDVRHIKDAVIALSKNNEVTPFVRLVEKFLRGIDNRDFIRFDEKYIKLLMMTYVSLTKMYLIKSEYPVGGGYVDLALLPNRVHELNHYFLFELKHIKKGQGTDQLVEVKRAEAIGQIKSYADAEEWKGIPNLKKYVFVFSNDGCKVAEEVEV